MVEISGPESSGKTVFLCEIAGDIQRKGGQVMFRDPEARLNREFAQTFDLNFDAIEYGRPNTVTELFTGIQSWKPEGEGAVNGIMADSLAALSTDMELGEEGDKMGARRAKEFSEGFRKTARILASKNYLIVASNQLRDTMATQAFAQKSKPPGGWAIGYYSSLRLRTNVIQKLSRQTTMGGKARKLTYGIQVEVAVTKSSVWKPHRSATVTIDWDYGIDDVRENLIYIKDMTGADDYRIDDEKLGTKISTAIAAVEEAELQDKLRNKVIDLWEELEQKLTVERKPKKR